MEQTYHLEPHKLGVDDYMSAHWKLTWARTILLCLSVSILVTLFIAKLLESFLPPLGYLLLFFIVWGFYLWLSNAGVRRRTRSKENLGLFLTRYVTLGEKEILIKIENGISSTVPFATLVRVRDIGRFYVAYLAANQYLLLPTFIFTPEADAYFRERVGLPKLK